MEKFSFVLGYDPASKIFVERKGIAKRVAHVLLLAYKESFLGYGGMVVMSTDVNATSGSGLKNRIKSFARKMLQRFFKDKYTDEVLNNLAREYNIETGWSIGNLFRGRYFSKEQQLTFDEKSFTVDIRGAPLEFVKEVAVALCKKFHQESVLLVEHKTNKTWMINP